ncbi:unnamed protein product [Effrenium voratum]|uniref:CCHC-type domain-containing protein n=1 Tax=Effrenium voratum TaxID=2562239 RepID=A0AA36I8N2_9DINO|nr:unnamed protein product [Effrenium voratum]
MSLRDLGLQWAERQKAQGPKERPCYSCGSVEHLARDCPESLCHFCGRAGHLARACSFGQSLSNSDQFILCSRDCVPRRFLMPLHQARTSFAEVTEGRVDVGCRSVTAALFRSESYRRNSEIRLTFCAGDANLPWNEQVDAHRGVTVVVTGGLMRGLRPDEQSVANRLRTVLEGKEKDVKRGNLGLRQVPGGLRGSLQECLAEGGPAVLLLLDPAGLDIEEAAKRLRRQNFNQLLVLLGDDRGLVKEEMELEGMDQLEAANVTVWGRGQLTCGPIDPVQPRSRKDLLVVLATERAELERLLLGHRLQVEASLRRLAAAERAVDCAPTANTGSPASGSELYSLLLSTPPTLQPPELESADPIPENPFKAEKIETCAVWAPAPDLQWGRNGSMASDASAVSGASGTSSADAGDRLGHQMPASQVSPGSTSADRKSGDKGQGQTRAATPQMADIFMSEEQPQGWERITKAVRSSIDYLAAVLVLLNSIVLLMELEFKGNAIGARMGLSEGPTMEEVEPVFQNLDRFFVFVFLAELLVRMAVEQGNFRREWTNWLDTALVILGLVDFYFSLQVTDGDVVPKDIVLLRLMRALKSLRAIRMMRSFRLFRGLRLLVKACQCFLPSLCWAMVLLGVFMTMGALIMGNLLQSFITDETALLEDREWIWNRYGTAYRATYTLYEITFAGNWPTNARPVMERVSHAFVIFFVLYVTVIAFAVIRVISAVFLKDTLDAAQNDAEHLVVDRLRKKAEYVEKLETIFRAIDDSGDGTITEERFERLEAALQHLLDCQLDERLTALEHPNSPKSMRAPSLSEFAGVKVDVDGEGQNVEHFNSIGETMIKTKSSGRVYYVDADEFGANRDKALQLPITHVKSSECPRSSNVSEAKSASEKGNVSIKTSRRKSLELKDHISTPKSYKTLTKHGSKVSEKTLNAHSKEYYSFGESTWDLVIFIGTGALGPAGSLQTFLLAVVNVCMQGIFVGIAMYNFLAPEVTDKTIIDAFRWRRSSAHALSQYDEISGESLAQRVCDGDQSLHVSGIQVSLYQNIRKYLKPEAQGIELCFTGQALCLVSLICWYLMVAKELSHALALHRSVASVKRGQFRMEPRENPFTQVVYYRLVALPRARVIFSAALLLYRFIAALLLIYVGTFFLVYTVNVTELILNAVALGIILDIDDLLFDALATTPGRHLLHHLDPLPMRSFPRFRGADVKSLSMSFIIPTLVLVVYFSMLSPMVANLNLVKDTLCGGNLEFVWSLDKRGVTVLAPTVGGGWEEYDNSMQTKAISEAQGQVGITNATKYGLWVQGVGFLSASTSLTLDELVDEHNSDCGDLGNEEPMLNYLRDTLNNQSIMGCADVVQFCNSISKMPDWGLDGGAGFVTRMLCSDTCGCTDPGGEFALVQGCPYGPGRACSQSPKYALNARQGLCAERSVQQLRSYVPWQKWLQSIVNFAQAGGDMKGQKEALVLADAMWNYGCGFAPVVEAQNITWGNCFEWNTAFDWELKTVSFFCPQTCVCKDQPGCPRPQGKTCDEVQFCLQYESRYYCESDGYVPVYGEMTIHIGNTFLSVKYQPQFVMASQSALAWLAGTPPAFVRFPIFPHFHPGDGRRLYNLLMRFKVFALGGMNKTLINEKLSAVTAEQYSGVLLYILNNMSVPIDEIGISAVAFSVDS